MNQTRLVRLTVSALLLLCASAGSAAEGPNFILINVDDLGYGDVGPFGSANETPNLDRMTREGRKLTSHYAAPVCSPSRAALMTGCYPKRVLPIPGVLFPAAAVGLNPEEVTIAEVLKSAGYVTACIGKWHLGDQPEFLPTRQGFDSYFGLPYSNDMGPAEEGAKSNPGQPLSQRKPNRNAAATNETGVTAAQPPLPLLENERVVERVGAAEQATLTRRYTERAVAFVQENKERPFFLYLPHTAVHFPLYPAVEFTKDSPDDLQAAWVREVDWSVGQVLDAVREAGIEERTLVLFTSDNGGPLNHGADNGPLRGGKGSTWEGGVRVPLIAWWPGRVPAGTESGAISGMIDILPTFAALAGTPVAPGRTIDGRDISALLFAEPEAESTHDAYYIFRGLELEAVRSGQWKLHVKRNELYDLSSDIGETRNVAADHADVVARLRELAAAADRDLGATGIGPGVRPLGRVANPRPLIDNDGAIREDLAVPLLDETPSARFPGQRTAEDLKKEGFIPLFDGASLERWDVKTWHEGHWVARAGIIDYDGKAAGQRADNSLWTKDSFDDFVLYAEWRLPTPPATKPHPIVLYNGDFLLDENGKRITRPRPDSGDSGIVFRGTQKCQANIWSQELGSGEINGYRTDRKMPTEVRRGAIPIKAADRPAGEWNAFRITLKGDQITIELNGETVIPTVRLPDLPPTGPIGLQHHGDPVQFRNIWVKKLGAAGTP